MAPLSPAACSCPSLVEEEDDLNNIRRPCPKYRPLDETLTSTTPVDIVHDSILSRRRRRPLTDSSSVSSIESECFEECIKPSLARYPPLTSLVPLLVFIDMFAVALVVPLLPTYYQSAGVTNAGQRELFTSIFSVAQIVGGVALGALIDAQWLSRRKVLFLSFGGSAVSYFLIAQGSFSALVMSRILVGLVKQTMTITKTLLTTCTTDETRALHMGRLSASATAAWVLGPSVGAVLFKYADPRAPALLASILFLMNLVLAAMFLPEDEEIETNNPKGRLAHSLMNQSASTTTATTRRCNRSESGSIKTTSNIAFVGVHDKASTVSFLSNIQSCFSSRVLRSLVCANLMITWVARSTNCNNLSTFYEVLYRLEPHHRGYISSYQQILGFLTESFFISPFLSWSGGERNATCVCALLVSVALGLQFLHCTSLAVFLGIVCPLSSLAYSVIFTSLQTLVTTAVPMDSIFSVLAALDVLQNAVSVSVPFYRAAMFARLSGDNETAGLMEGDPDPRAWLYTCAIHWFAASIALGSLLLLYGNQNRKNGKGGAMKDA